MLRRQGRNVVVLLGPLSLVCSCCCFCFRTVALGSRDSLSRNGTGGARHGGSLDRRIGEWEMGFVGRLVSLLVVLGMDLELQLSAGVGCRVPDLNAGATGPLPRRQGKIVLFWKLDGARVG